MQVLLDGQRIEVKRPTLAAALEAGRAAAGERNRVVIEARVDGRELRQDEFDHADASIGDEAIIELVSAEPFALVRVTLLELVGMLEGASQAQQRAADHITAGRLKEGLEELGGAFEVWNGVQRAVGDGLQLLGMELDQVEVMIDGASTPVAGYVQSLAGHLNEIKRTLQAQDYSGLSDVLTYDLKDEAVRWQGLLESLAETVRRRGS